VNGMVGVIGLAVFAHDISFFLQSAAEMGIKTMRALYMRTLSMSIYFLYPSR
jgi:hypothetical protein